MPENINLQVNKQKISEARLYYTLDKGWLIGTLKGILYLSGGASLASLVLWYLDKLTLSPAYLLAALFVTAFVVLNFITGYLEGLAQKQLYLTSANDVNGLLSFDVLRCAQALTAAEPDVYAFIRKVVKTKRVQFVIEKMNLSNEQFEALLKSLPQQVSQTHLLGYIIEEALGSASSEPGQSITSADIFYGVLKMCKNYQQTCLALELDDSDIQNIIFWANRYFGYRETVITLADKLKTAAAGIGSDWSAGYTLTLNKYGTDITRESLAGGFSVEGREDILESIEAALVNESKQSCLLIGPTGVGKTTIAYALANKLFWGKSTATELNYKRVVRLNAQAVAAASNDMAYVQNILTGILNDAVTAGNVILFIDEIQSLFAVNDSLGSINAAEIIQPYLENSNIRIIGTITEGDYESYIRPRPAIAGNFESIKIEPADSATTIKIMCDIAIYKTAKYRRQISFGAIKEIYRLSERFDSGKEMPARAIDMLLEIVSAKNIGSNIDKAAVQGYFQTSTKIPVAELNEESKTNLMQLQEKIASRLIGQTEAVEAVVGALKRALTQERKSAKPIGSFLFFGPTGVGKTELAKSLAWAYFGDEEAMIRMDMSQYKETGSIRNFIGYKIPGKTELDGGEFVKKVRQKPHSVILLDEIEKADHEVLDLFLQALDEGYLNDGAGQKVTLTNTIIIATSNAGALEIKDAVSKGEKDFKDRVLDSIQNSGIFRPEFLNRFDGIILFKPLTEEEILKVATLSINKVIASYAAKGYQFAISDELVRQLAKEGYQPELGARPMQRVIQDKLENFVADRILDNTYQKGGSYTINLTDLNLK